jgi:hypothetical protein
VDPPFPRPHRLDVTELEKRYGRDPDSFLRREGTGGSEILWRPRFSLDVFPKVPLAYILWKADEEFPPRISTLFDSTIQAHLPLDIIGCMVAETTRRLGAGHSE